MKAVAAMLVTSASLAAAAHVNARPFSFAGVEFMPRDQRVPAAQAFVAEKLPPGTPIASALETLRRASAFCGKQRAPTEPITCTHRSFDRHPLDPQLITVTWTVEIVPSADGTVASATVRRSTNGFPSASLPAPAPVNARPFSFAGVEFMPRDQRVPAAQAFVAEKLPPGTPIASALETLRRASAFCRRPRAPSDPITCIHPSFDRDPLYAQLADVTWTVKVTPSADGTVAAATVRRSTNGF
ncbi:MAG TPA: hypothetical protein VGG92_22080 [Caulobacteraceae bacterium]